MKSFFYIICIVAGSLFVHRAQAQFDQRWLDLINKGKQKYETNSYLMALDYFRQASQVVPTDTTAYLYITDCASRLRRAADVRWAYDNLVFLKYFSPQVYEKVIVAVRDYENDIPQARQLCDEALTRYPDNIVLKTEKAITLYRAGDYVACKSLLQDILNQQADNYRALGLLYQIAYTQNKDYTAAIDIAKQAQRQYPDSMVFHENEADAYLAMGNTDAAKQKYEILVKNNPKNPKAYYNLALWYFQRNDTRSAIDWCHKAVEVDANYTDALYNLGTFYLFYGLEYNKMTYNMTAEQYLENGSPVEMQALEYFKLAQPYLKRVLELKPSDLDAFENLNTADFLIENLSKNVAIHTQLSAKQIPQDVEIKNVHFSYTDTDKKRLASQQTGFVTFDVQNNATTSQDVQIALTQPLATPGLKYNDNTQISNLQAGETKQVSIPVSYNPNDIQTPGIARISDVGNKIRVMATSQNQNFAAVDVPITVGDVPISGDATQDSSDTEDLDFFSPAPIQRNFLLLIGINAYLHWSPLANAVADAEKIRKTLTQQYGFKTENIYILYNQDATQQNIRNTLVKIKRELTPNDNLVVYFAGHGYYDAEFDEGSWIPYDAATHDQTQYLSNQRLLRYIETLDTRHTFVVADACFSGSLFVSESSVGVKRGNDQLNSRWGLSSGNIEKVSDGAAQQNSPFANALDNYLQSNSVVTVTNLFDYINQTFKQNNASQTPICKPLNMQGNKGGEFVLYKLQGQ